MVKKKINTTSETKTEPTKKVRRNFVFNIIYQALVVLTPLITAPYLARVLGANNIGQFSFAYTIVCYFVIFAYIGFQQYAQRAIAEVQGNKIEQSRRFWQIVIIRLFTVTFSLGVLFILYAVNAFGEYSSLILVFSILIGATAFDINFYFHGKENFFVVMIINLVIRFIYLAAIFLLIRSPSDLGMYALLYSLMVVGGYLSMWALLPRHLVKTKLHGLNFKKHFLSSLFLFLPVAAVSIYALLDKTLIGLLIHGQQYYLQGNAIITASIAEVENGYYFQADRIVKALLSILLAFGTVMTTRNAIEYKHRRYGEVKKNVYRSFRFVFALGIPMLFGTIIVANSFVPLYFGSNYSVYPQYPIDGVASLLMLYAPVILLSGCSNVLGSQYLLPTKQDKKYSSSVLIGFALNIVFNSVLIPMMGAAGAVIGTLISELEIVLIQYLYVCDDISLGVIFMNVWKYILAGALMFAILFPLDTFLLQTSKTGNIVNLAILIPTGVGLYYLILLALRDHDIFKYTKLFFVGTGHFFKNAANRVVVQRASLAVTISSASHFENIGKREPADNYSKIKSKEDDGEEE